MAKKPLVERSLVCATTIVLVVHERHFGVHLDPDRSPGNDAEQLAELLIPYRLAPEGSDHDIDAVRGAARSSAGFVEDTKTATKASRLADPVPLAAARKSSSGIVLRG